MRSPFWKAMRGNYALSAFAVLHSYLQFLHPAAERRQGDGVHLAELMLALA